MPHHKEHRSKKILSDESSSSSSSSRSKSESHKKKKRVMRSTKRSAKRSVSRSSSRAHKGSAVSKACKSSSKHFLVPQEDKKKKKSSGRKLSPYNVFLSLNTDKINQWIKDNKGLVVTTKSGAKKTIDPEIKGSLMVAASYLFANPGKRPRGIEDVNASNLAEMTAKLRK